MAPVEVAVEDVSQAGENRGKSRWVMLCASKMKELKHGIAHSFECIPGFLHTSNWD